uniref:Uncharacterized protein n=1 Tax=Pundamilia nyererei TaxID=303518 RepID=A0A3B4EUR5_9CICH
DPNAMCGAVTQQTGSHQGSDLMEKSAENVQVNVQTLDSIPTEKVINNTFVPQLLHGHINEFASHLCGRSILQESFARGLEASSTFSPFFTS